MCHEENDLKRQQKTAIIVKDAEDKIILMKKNQRCRRGIWQCRHFIVIEKKMWHGSMRQLKLVAVQMHREVSQHGSAIRQMSMHGR